MANSISDKAVYIYDLFFSAGITSGELESQLKNSSLNRLAFEEVISYPNLLDQMKAHDRYDEIIGIDTYAYSLILQNITREENSQLESNAFLVLTNESTTQQEFDAFLQTVSGHIGYGLIIDNKKTSYDIAANVHAVNLILNNQDAVNALLNSEAGLKAFGQTPAASAAIFNNEEIFKSLRTSLLFDQTSVFDQTFSSDTYVEYVGGKYFIKPSGSHDYYYVSDDMVNWTKITHPVYQFYYNPSFDSIAYDELNGVWFFVSHNTGAPPFFTKDFVTWQNVSATIGNAGCLSITNFNGEILVTYRHSNNNYRIGRIIYALGDETYSITDIPTLPNNPGYYYWRKGEGDYIIASDGNHYYKLFSKDYEFSVSNFWANDGGTSYRGIRGLSWANGRYFYTNYYSQSGDTRIGVRVINPTLEHFQGTQDAPYYWLHYEGTEHTRILYANGVYITNVPGGYAISLNGFVWDKKLFDITYSFSLGSVDERGIVGHVPSTTFILASYDVNTGLDTQITTTTTTTAAPALNLPEYITNLDCLVDTLPVNIVEYNGLKMLFNGETDYKNTNYVLTNGSYKILNVPEEYPIGVLNYGKYQEISYTGLPSKKHQIKVFGTDNDYVYDFYYGDVTINVKGNFERVSLYYYKSPNNQGYLGMEKIFVHQDYLSSGGTTASDTVGKVSDTSIYASSIRNFDCIGNEALEQTDLTTIPPLTTTTTTSTPSYTVLPIPTTTTTTAAPDYGDENYTVGTSLLTSSEYDIFETGGLLGIQGGSLTSPTTFSSLASLGERLVLGTGTYVFNVEADKPIAIEGATSSPFFGPQHSNISYSGDFYKRSIKSINGVPYYFYHGRVVVIVDAPFQTVSLYSFSAGYAGAENAFSWDRSTTTTTTAAPTTTTTTDALTTYTRCFAEEIDVVFNGTEFEFDGYAYESNVKNGMNTGTYVFKDVPQATPIAFYNYGKWDVFSYSGTPSKSITHLGDDGHQYQYYYGDVTVNVTGDFGIITYDTNTFGHAGGQDKIIFSGVCPIAVQPTTTTTTTVSPLYYYTTSTTTEAPATTTTTTAAPTTTTTTLAPTTAELCLVSGATGNTVAYTGGQYVFNGSYGLYGMTTGTYVFKNVSASHPIAFHNFGKTTNITYSGQYSQGTKLGLDGNSYTYYYGDVTVTVNGDFGLISYECWYHGYMGGQNNLIYDNTNCT